MFKVSECFGKKSLTCIADYLNITLKNANNLFDVV